jgi:hypothetical protein
MEGIPALRELLEPDDFMAKIDLKDAYTVVPIAEDSRQYLTFQNRGIVYRYRALPFGVSIAPRIFSKLMRYAVEPLRVKGIRLVYYLDDICLLAKTKTKLQEHVKITIDHLSDLGFIINREKSDTTAKKIQDVLGFTFNTKNMRISVPKPKLDKILQKIRQILRDPSKLTCRNLAGLLGKITSMIPAIGEALLRIRYLQICLARSLHSQKYQWDKPCLLCPTAKTELNWWISNAMMRNGLPIIPIQNSLKDPTVIIHVDASDTGWGITS